ARALGGREVAAELILEHAVNALDLLFLTQLNTVAGKLGLPRLAVLPRREIALFNRALFRIAALPLEEQFHPFAAAQPADRSDITSHSITFHPSIDDLAIDDLSTHLLINRQSRIRK